MVKSNPISHVRRSKRDGRRKSTRRKKTKKRHKTCKKQGTDSYDRDLGGYKFVNIHKDNKWHPTKRSRIQQSEEDRLCLKLKNKSHKMNKDGYCLDDFFVEQDTGEISKVEETDQLFSKVDKYTWSDDSDTDDSDEDDFE